MGSPGKGSEDLQHRLSRRAAEGFCDLQASGGKPLACPGERGRCHEERGDAIMRRRGWGGASSSRLRARLCFPGPSLDASRGSAGQLVCVVLRLYSGAGGGDDDCNMLAYYVDTVLGFVLVESGPSAGLVLFCWLLLTLLLCCGKARCSAVRWGAK